MLNKKLRNASEWLIHSSCTMTTGFSPRQLLPSATDRLLSRSVRFFFSLCRSRVCVLLASRLASDGFLMPLCISTMTQRRLAPPLFSVILHHPSLSANSLPYPPAFLSPFPSLFSSVLERGVCLVVGLSCFRFFFRLLPTGLWTALPSFFF